MTQAEFEERFRVTVGAGDWDGAATLVIQHYGARVHGYLRAVLRDDDLADDVFQAWAENLWKGLPDRRAEGSLTAWVYRVAWNAATRTFRDPYRRRKERLATTMASRLAGSIALASRAASVARRQDRLEKLRARLTREEQSLLTLKLDRGLSWAEVAEVMAEDGDGPEGPGPRGGAPSEGTLRKRYERLKDKLARLLQDPDADPDRDPES